MAAGQTLASDVDTKYGVVDATTRLLKRAKTVDSAVTGGRGTALAAGAFSLAGVWGGEGGWDRGRKGGRDGRD